ncbi:MAG: DUF4258 domain-containing protein [Anaerolineae bacterium]|nr:DUF4258 domain-containing protein [Anaerolineales bacterium]
MDLDLIQQLVQQRGYRLTAHASIEATKDGISPADIRYVIFHGKIIEEYPEREYSDLETCLIYGVLPDKIPLHVVIDVVHQEAVVVVTAYIPDRDKWLASQARRHKRGKKK